MPDYGNCVTEIRQRLLIANTSKVLTGRVGLVQKLEASGRSSGRGDLGQVPKVERRLVTFINIKTLAAILYQAHGDYGVAVKLGGFVARQIGQFGGHFFR